MRVVMDDGTEAEAGPGDVVSIPPGNDAEIVGNETCVFIDFTGFETYPKRRRECPRTALDAALHLPARRIGSAAPPRAKG